MNSPRILFLLASALLLGSCSSTGVSPTDASTQHRAVVIVNPVSFSNAVTGLTVATRIAYPRRGRHLPVVLFSHGAYSSKDEYNLILDDWAAHGYIVIAPTHRDSTTLGVKRGSNDPRSFQWRLDDMALLLAQLQELGSKVPALAGRVDAMNVVAAGHSFGGLVAQTLGGASYYDPVAAKTVALHYPVIKAVIIFSGAGRVPPILRTEDFASLTVPTLVTVGTEDLKQTELSGYRWRREPYDLLPNGNKYLLVLQGADHYLGGLVCRSDLPKQPLGPQWVDLFNRSSVAFMDAALRRDRASPVKLQRLLDDTAAGRNPLARTWHNASVSD
jgi:dienelactone hydrolase